MTPRKLIRLDGLGALLSAFLLGVVLVHFQPFFGMPTAVLYLLAAFPCLFALYDFFIYCRIQPLRGLHLRIIAGANLAYCLLSGMLLLGHSAELTTLGWVYFSGEILLVCTLAIVEFRVAAAQG